MIKLAVSRKKCLYLNNNFPVSLSASNQSLKEGKNYKSFLASQLPLDMQYFSRSSQYTTFSQSLVNADFFSFWDRP